MIIYSHLVFGHILYSDISHHVDYTELTGLVVHAGTLCCENKIDLQLETKHAYITAVMLGVSRPGKVGQFVCIACS